MNSTDHPPLLSGGLVHRIILSSMDFSAFFSGWAGGVVGVLASHPQDTGRTHQVHTVLHLLCVKVFSSPSQTPGPNCEPSDKDRKVNPFECMVCVCVCVCARACVCCAMFAPLCSTQGYDWRLSSANHSCHFELSRWRKQLFCWSPFTLFQRRHVESNNVGDQS